MDSCYNKSMNKTKTKAKTDIRLHCTACGSNKIELRARAIFSFKLICFDCGNIQPARG